MTRNQIPSLLWQPDIPESVALGYGKQMAALLQSPSLTAALRGLGFDFTVKLLDLGIGATGAWFGPSEKQKEFIRDVLLCLDGEPVVWARSACEPHSQWRGVLDCGTQPLGERLFDGSLPLVRSAFEFSGVQECRTENGLSAQAFAARRSWFGMRGGAAVAGGMLFTGSGQVRRLKDGVWNVLKGRLKSYENFSDGLRFDDR